MRLVLCEKPSQGRDIAKFLGATQRGEGFLNGPGVTVTGLAAICWRQLNRKYMANSMVSHGAPMCFLYYHSSGNW